MKQSPCEPHLQPAKKNLRRHLVHTQEWHTADIDQLAFLPWRHLSFMTLSPVTMTYIMSSNIPCKMTPARFLCFTFFPLTMGDLVKPLPGHKAAYVFVLCCIRNAESLQWQCRRCTTLVLRSCCSTCYVE